MNDYDAGHATEAQGAADALEDWDWEAHTIRRETGLVEHLCPHGVGHPNPGSVIWMAEVTGQESWGVHGCDGCCRDESFPSLEDSLRHCHAIIRQQRSRLHDLLTEQEEKREVVLQRALSCYGDGES